MRTPRSVVTLLAVRAMLLDLQRAQPISEFQLVQGKLADMYARLQACRAFVMRTAAAADAGAADRKDCAAVILFCAENATQTALDAIQVRGSSIHRGQGVAWSPGRPNT